MTCAFHVLFQFVNCIETVRNTVAIFPKNNPAIYVKSKDVSNRVVESETKCPTQTFPKFRTPTPQHKVNVVWL